MGPLAPVIIRRAMGTRKNAVVTSASGSRHRRAKAARDMALLIPPPERGRSIGFAEQSRSGGGRRSCGCIPPPQPSPFQGEGAHRVLGTSPHFGEVAVGE